MPKTTNPTVYPTLQNTKINSEPFVFQNNSFVDYPVAPIISAKFYDVNGIKTLKIRATLYIESEVTINPFVEIPVLDNEKKELTINYYYDYKETIPTSCNVWYVEIDYCIPKGSKIKEIISHLINIDPQTSRGTRLAISE